MTDHRQSAGRWNEQELRRKPPRIPRIVIYQTHGQLPMTLLALLLILAAVFGYWVIA